MTVAKGAWRPYRQEMSDMRPAPPGLWLIVRQDALKRIGAMPIVGWGHFEQVTEYGRSSRWMPVVCEDWTVVAAETVPGAVALLHVPGGGPPTEEQVLSLVEQEDTSHADDR